MIDFFTTNYNNNKKIILEIEQNLSNLSTEEIQMAINHNIE
jgi:hypothetical protein